MIGYFFLLPVQTQLEYRLRSQQQNNQISETPLDLLVLTGGFVFSGIVLALMNHLF